MSTGVVRGFGRLENPGLFAGVVAAIMAIALIESFAVMTDASVGRIGYVVAFALVLLAISYGSYRILFSMLSWLFPSRAPTILEWIFWISMLGSAVALVGFPVAEQHSFPANHHVFATVGGSWAAARARSLL